VNDDSSLHKAISLLVGFCMIRRTPVYADLVFLLDSNTRWAYKYDARNYLVEQDAGSWRTLYSNDESGNPIEETQYDRDGTVLKEVRFSYEFDSRGNWIKKTPAVIQKNEKLRYYYEQVVYRAIDYY
jgi:hypothetical protein